MGSPSLSDQRSCVRVASSTGCRPSAVDTPAANREEKSGNGHVQGVIGVRVSTLQYSVSTVGPISRER